MDQREERGRAAARAVWGGRGHCTRRGGWGPWASPGCSRTEPGLRSTHAWQQGLTQAWAAVGDNHWGHLDLCQLQCSRDHELPHTLKLAQIAWGYALPVLQPSRQIGELWALVVFQSGHIKLQKRVEKSKADLTQSQFTSYSLRVQYVSAFHDHGVWIFQLKTVSCKHCGMTPSFE